MTTDETAPKRPRLYYLHRTFDHGRWTVTVSIIENRRTRPPMLFFSPARPLRITPELKDKIAETVAELKQAPRLIK